MQNLPQLGDIARLSYTHDPVEVIANISPGIIQVKLVNTPSIIKTFTYRQNGRWVYQQMDMRHGTYLVWSKD